MRERGFLPWTPRRGSDKVGLAVLVAEICRIALGQPNAKILNNLQKGCDVSEARQRPLDLIGAQLLSVSLYDG